MTSARSEFVGGPHVPAERARDAFVRCCGLWLVRGFSLHVWARKSDGQAIGSGGVWHPFAFDEPELSWSLWSADHEGQGYVTEAMQAVMPYAKSLGLASCVSYIEPGNARSIAVAKRLGAVHDPATTNEDGDLIYRHWGAGPQRGAA